MSLSKLLYYNITNKKVLGFLLKQILSIKQKKKKKTIIKFNIKQFSNNNRNFYNSRTPFFYYFFENPTTVLHVLFFLVWSIYRYQSVYIINKPISYFSTKESWKLEYNSLHGTHGEREPKRDKYQWSCGGTDLVRRRQRFEWRLDSLPSSLLAAGARRLSGKVFIFFFLIWE